MRIPFDVKYRSQIESGEYKVETRDGKPARIICWDMDSYNTIVVFKDERKIFEARLFDFKDK